MVGRIGVLSLSDRIIAAGLIPNISSSWMIPLASSRISYPDFVVVALSSWSDSACRSDSLVDG